MRWDEVKFKGQGEQEMRKQVSEKKMLRWGCNERIRQ